jgi:hypothetical protein
MLRASVRPVPKSPALHGLRLTAFIDHDAYVEDAARRRAIVGATYEHRFFNTGINYLSTADRTRVINPELDGHGFSAWVTPKTPKGHGLEGLFRYDHLVQEQSASPLDGERNRTIAGVAYWFPKQGSVSSALLLDYEQVNNHRYVPERPTERRWALHALVNF